MTTAIVFGAITILHLAALLFAMICGEMVSTRSSGAAQVSLAISLAFFIAASGWHFATTVSSAGGCP